MQLGGVRVRVGIGDQRKKKRKSKALQAFDGNPGHHFSSHNSDVHNSRQWLEHTVDLEIFVLYKFRVLNFRVKIFLWSRIPTKIF